MADLPPDYALHDGAYRKLRQQGAQGWNNEGAQAYAEMLGLVAPGLPVVTPGARVNLLEIGCGAGNFSQFLARQGYSVTGVDISPTAIDWATERSRADSAHLHFRVDNVLDLASCEAVSFDGVVDGHCLHCIIGDDRARCLASAHRVLKEGGVFVVLTMCGDVSAPQLLKAFDPVERVTRSLGRPARYIGHVESIVAEVEAAGFFINQVRVISRKDVNDQDDLLIFAPKPGKPKKKPEDSGF